MKKDVTKKNRSPKNHLSIKDNNSYIAICITAMLLLVGFNSFFYIMKDALGYGPGTFFYIPEDRFADLIKLALSYREVLRKIPDINNSLNSLSPIYQNYFIRNPYGDITRVATEGLTHFHLTPISSLLCIFVGSEIGYGITPKAILFTLFYSCTFLAFISTKNIIKSYKKSFLLLGLITASYPFLFMVTRGNYQAYFCAIGVLAFLNSLFINKKIDMFSMFLFAVAVNFRPNAIILLLALPMLLGIKKSILPAIQIALITFAIYMGAYSTLNSIYPDYTIPTFLKALSAYNKIYIIGDAGNAFNASIWTALKMYGKSISMNITSITNTFHLFSLCILIAVGRLIFKKNTIIAYYPFILSSLYILLNQVAADYHLLIFIAPIFIIYNNYELWQNDKSSLIVITASTLLLLAPKSYFSIGEVGIQVIINPLIMISTTVYLLYKIETNTHIAQPISQQMGLDNK